MALSEYEKKRIIDMLDDLDDHQREAVTKSESSLWAWLKRAARWFWDKFTDTVIGGVINWLLGWF